MKITRTELAMVVICKCTSIVAATMLYGGIEISADFMDTVAKIANNGGEIRIVNTTKEPVSLTNCKCYEK